MSLDSRLQAAEEAGSGFSDAELAGLVQSLPEGSAQREGACEALVARYQPVIRSCVRRYRGPRELDDELMQVGYLGLMKAISNFDPEIGTSLPAYVRPCVSGEIKRYFRDRLGVSQMQVSRLLRRALGFLRSRLAGTIPDPEASPVRRGAAG